MSRMTVRRSLAAAAAAAMAAAALPSGASADITIGADLSHPPSTNVVSSLACQGTSSYCYVVPSSPGSATPIASPIDGVARVIRLNSAASFQLTNLAFVGLHKTPAGTFDVTWTDPIDAPLRQGINTFTGPGRAMKAGDVVGLASFQIDNKAGVPLIFASVAGAKTYFQEFNGVTKLVQGRFENAEMQIQAVVETDGDGDGWADSSDDCPKDPAVHRDPCPVDVQISQTLSAPTIAPNGAVTVTATLRNNGPSDVKGKVQWRIGGVTGATIAGCVGGAPDATAACAFELAAGQTQSYAAQVRAPAHEREPSAGAQPLTVTAAFGLSSRSTDTVAANNTATSTLQATWPDLVSAVDINRIPARIGAGKLRRRGITVSVQAGEAVKGRIVLRARGRTLGRTSFRTQRSATVTRRVRLNRAGRRVLRRARRAHRSLRLTVVLVATDASGNDSTDTSTVTVR